MSNQAKETEATIEGERDCCECGEHGECIVYPTGWGNDYVVCLPCDEAVVLSFIDGDGQ